MKKIINVRKKLQQLIALVCALTLGNRTFAVNYSLNELCCWSEDGIFSMFDFGRNIGLAAWKRDLWGGFLGTDHTRLSIGESRSVANTLSLQIGTIGRATDPLWQATKTIIHQRVTAAHPVTPEMPTRLWTALDDVNFIFHDDFLVIKNGYEFTALLAWDDERWVRTRAIWQEEDKLRLILFSRDLTYNGHNVLRPGCAILSVKINPNGELQFFEQKDILNQASNSFEPGEVLVPTEQLPTSIQTFIGFCQRNFEPRELWCNEN